MSRGLKVVLAVLVVFLVVIGIAVYAAAQSSLTAARAKLKETQTTLVTDWQTFEPRIREDEKRWKDDPLFAKHEGGDAAALLGPHIRWTSDKQAGEIPDALVTKFRELSTDWPKHVKELDLAALDTSWLEHTGEYGFWALVPPMGAKYSVLDEASPQIADLMGFAKIHLAKGLQSGDARKAAHDVRELARLGFTSENLITQVSSVAILTAELNAFEQATADGNDVTGWTPVSKADIASLKHVTWATQAPNVLEATGALADAKLSIGECASLRESLGAALLLRGLLQAELPERYKTLSDRLEASPCRLTQLRAAWKKTDGEGQLPTNGAAFCISEMGTENQDCKIPRWLPLPGAAAAAVGLTLANANTVDWLRWYRKDAAE